MSPTGATTGPRRRYSGHGRGNRRQETGNWQPAIIDAAWARHCGATPRLCGCGCPAGSAATPGSRRSSCRVASGPVSDRRRCKLPGGSGCREPRRLHPQSGCRRQGSARDCLLARVHPEVGLDQRGSGSCHSRSRRAGRDTRRLERRTGYLRSRNRRSASHRCVARRLHIPDMRPPRSLRCSHLGDFARSGNPIGVLEPAMRATRYGRDKR
jgi:hypothetical protein